MRLPMSSSSSSSSSSSLANRYHHHRLHDCSIDSHRRLPRRISLLQATGRVSVPTFVVLSLIVLVVVVVGGGGGGGGHHVGVGGGGVVVVFVAADDAGGGGGGGIGRSRFGCGSDPVVGFLHEKGWSECRRGTTTTGSRQVPCSPRFGLTTAATTTATSTAETTTTTTTKWTTSRYRRGDVCRRHVMSTPGTTDEGRRNDSSTSPKTAADDDAAAAAERALKRTAAHLEKLNSRNNALRPRTQRQKRKKLQERLEHGIVAGEPADNDGDGGEEEEMEDGEYDVNVPPDPLGMERERIAKAYLIQSANSLKEELKKRKLPRNGRKPDLAERLAEDDLVAKYGGEAVGIKGGDQYDDDQDGGSYFKGEGTIDSDGANDVDGDVVVGRERRKSRAQQDPFASFAGLSDLSPSAREALKRAQFREPTPIQKVAVPTIYKNQADPRNGDYEPLILHAETGSGKTLAYVLPIAELLWRRGGRYQQTARRGLMIDDDDDGDGDGETYTIVLTPTRELAAQVSGIASVLAPEGSVRFVSRPTNLMSTGDRDKDRGDISVDAGGRGAALNPRVFVGSARAIMQSLYGDGGKTMPVPPTPKPLAMEFLRRVRCVVLDEVDRLLAVKKSRGEKKQKKGTKRHEKPSAVVTSAVIRLTLGRAHVIAVSATVGRPLRRELSRVLGLSPRQCPRILSGGVVVDDEDDDDDIDGARRGKTRQQTQGTGRRIVTIPDTVDHYLVPVEGETTAGKLLTTAYAVIKSLAGTGSDGDNPRMLLVLTRGYGISTANVIGALRHFNCRPEPTSLLDALEADGTDQMIEVHRQVSGATGVGESLSSSSSSSSSYFDRRGTGGDDDDDDDGAAGEDGPAEGTGDGGGYLLVTGEDTVRGLHLDGLDAVIIVGKPNGPDEYTHIAGRTGRAGRKGTVITVAHADNASSMRSWETMLRLRFAAVDQIDRLPEMMGGK